MQLTSFRSVYVFAKNTYFIKQIYFSDDFSHDEVLALDLAPLQHYSASEISLRRQDSSEELSIGVMALDLAAESE